MAVAHPVAPKQTAPAALAAYTMPNEEEIVAFLEARPRLVGIVDEAPNRVERVFGKKLPMRLKVFYDREEPGSAELVVEIVTGKSGTEAWIDADLNLLRLHEDWLVGIPRDVISDILFVTEPE